ncbi:MAG TPA: hypothetical protein DEP63_05490 [Candidatus Magasanikbacteria bacterium]|nr:hypothetical protein [Candidatus Magasanikbacteria bacterium]HCC14166.1 hypothetical protein [Candidatus Magasanikbacteria bacterium]HCM53930.1 hypothetical protein [Candidatus Magasanikbacteria bacterium]
MRVRVSPRAHMRIFYDLMIAIFLVGTIVPAGIILHSTKRRIQSWEYRHKRWSFLFVTLLLFGATTIFYGSFIEPTFLVIREQTIDIPGINTPIRIALVADFQVGPYKKAVYMDRIVDRILSLQPDIVMIAGDQVDNANGPTDETLELAPLARLVDAGIPTYAIHGNHEYGVSMSRKKGPVFLLGDVSTQVYDAMTPMGITYLVNDVVTTTIHGQDIQIFGGDSYLAGKLAFDALEETMTEIPTIALIHNPAAAWLAAKEKIDLILSGHTHGGQIRLPFVGPVGRIAEAIPADWYQGLVEVDTDTQLFVTSGTGETGARARLFNPPEVVLLKVE